MIHVITIMCDKNGDVCRTRTRPDGGESGRGKRGRTNYVYDIHGGEKYT
jgi:hypothetical protein